MKSMVIEEFWSVSCVIEVGLILFQLYFNKTRKEVMLCLIVSRLTVLLCYLLTYITMEV